MWAGGATPPALHTQQISVRPAGCWRRARVGGTRGWRHCPGAPGPAAFPHVLLEGTGGSRFSVFTGVISYTRTDTHMCIYTHLYTDTHTQRRPLRLKDSVSVSVKRWENWNWSWGKVVFTIIYFSPSRSLSRTNQTLRILPWTQDSLKFFNGCDVNQSFTLFQETLEWELSGGMAVDSALVLAVVLTLTLASAMIITIALALALAMAMAVAVAVVKAMAL